MTATEDLREARALVQEYLDMDKIYHGLWAEIYMPFKPVHKRSRRGASFRVR